ncbi:hypothetical protein P691DRAFT_296310 [Macrolepiota fuliginosa MF-IS2]|uniref:Uncharacterized protein n=1 Tax=Macrolepiota fuliginosa MF-IS2 TaxID=1400762 RepID=A0A9P5XI97_9AGAR|nr:hypothetical protein P691DRAFT_296310 [Macrolepiota fuliginosa MF-IS2]
MLWRRGRWWLRGCRMISFMRLHIMLIRGMCTGCCFLSLCEILLPLLWSVIDTRTSVMPERQISKLNKALKLKPERALLIKQWVIELAEKKHLVNLTRFWWFWKAGPPEQLWGALHTNCPLLKDIGVRRGPDELTISPDSALLRFSDLVGFHLTTHGVYRFHHPNQIAATNSTTRIPAGLYEMLVKRSPRLQELTFDGSCPHLGLWDVSPILDATWPELQSLSLGMIRDASKRLAQDDEAKAMKDFVGRHQELHNLHFLGAAHWASSEATYSITSHQKLVVFRGRYAQLKYSWTIWGDYDVGPDRRCATEAGAEYVSEYF